jgi:hypothetical protein
VNGRGSFLLVALFLTAILVAVGAGYLWARWESWRTAQLVSAPEGFGISAPAELEMSVDDEKFLVVDTPGEWVEAYPLEKGLKAVRTGPKTFLLLAARPETYRVLSYSAVHNRPTPYQITRVIVKDPRGSSAASKGSDK